MAMLIGAMLGLRFKVAILVPAIIIGSVVILAIGMSSGNNFWSVLLVMIVMITALQMGYLSGTVIHFSIAGSRVSPLIAAVIQRTAR